MSFRLLDAFVDAGFDFIDTADVYSVWVPGHTGRRIRKCSALVQEERQARQNCPGHQGRRAHVSGEERPEGCIHRAGGRGFAAPSADGSHRPLSVALRRSDDASGETLRAYDKLVKAGKVRIIGASNFTPARLKESLDLSAKNNLPRYETLQPEYNLSSDRNSRASCRTSA